MNQLRVLLPLFLLLSASRVLGQESAGPAEQEEPAPIEPVPVGPTPPTETPPPLPPAAAHEMVCDDQIDQDNDGLFDCADADCFDAASCHAGGVDERDDAHCGDWIDNDGDDAVDCDDQDCQTDVVSVCRGSYRTTQSQTTNGEGTVDELPELAPGQTVEDLIGHGNDADGERTDETCSDGIDNDNDGAFDCSDFGCRFDPQVTVCHGTPGIRFSVVAGVGASHTWNYDQRQDPSGATRETIGSEPSAGFTLLQLRALGPIPFINNSFFLINVRAEERVRLTFLNFQVPISGLGHYLSLNSGFGGLSPALIISAARQPLLDPAYYLYRSFEQGNGFAGEIGGPIDFDGVLRFRVWGAAGSGEFTGNVGGRFFRSDDRNFAWAAGGAVQFNILGHFDRFDTPFLYTPAPLTWGIIVGGKFDQRPAYRFAAANAYTVFRLWHFALRAESYNGFIMDDPETVPIQTGWNVQLGVLLVPRLLFMAGDVGGFYQPVPWSPSALPTDPSFDQQLEEFRWRVALMWYFWRSTGILAALYNEGHLQSDPNNPTAPEIERQVRLEARFRF